jgi:polyhydroxyalkanoate synthase
MARMTNGASAEPAHAESPPQAQPPKRRRAAAHSVKPEPREAPPPKAAEAPTPPAASGEGAPLVDVLLSRTGEDIEKLSLNLAEAMTRANNVFAAAFHDQSQAGFSAFRADPFDAQSALSKTWSQLAAQPETLREAHADLWRRYSEVWFNNAGRWMELMTGHTPPAGEAPRDKRFRDPEWRTNPYFSLLRETYLTTAQWIMDLVNQAEGLDENTRRKAAFFVKQAVDAASPSNFLFTNPTVLRETLRTRGQNLLQGLENLAQDLARGKGMLSITQTDMSAFELGKNIATTPGKVIYRSELFELLQYEPTTEEVYETPLLIFPPWINKFYILDLQAKNSFIRWLVDQGHTVFVVSWVNPDARLAEATFETYMRDGIYEAADAVSRALGVDKINAVGYCIGGTLLGASLAHMARIGDERIQSATFFAAQTDFELAGELKVFTDEAAIKYVEERIDAAGGFLDSQAMADTFNALRSNDLVWNYVVDNYYLGKRPPPFDLLYWNSDQTRMPRALHLFYLKRFYHENALAKGELTLLGERLDLRDVKIPVYMQSSREDHIAPAPSVYRSARLFGGPVEFMMAGSGHIAGVINPPAANKYQHWINPWLPATFEEWLDGAQERPGSWWPHWNKWLVERAGPLVSARRPGDGALPALEDAPGSYVKVKSAG